MRAEKALRVEQELSKPSFNSDRFKMVGLASRTEFNTLMKYGRRVHKDNLSSVIYFEKSAGGCLIVKTAYAVLKKIFPKAVTRNRIKRRLRAALRSVLSDHGALASGVLFFKITPSIKIVQTNFKELYSDLRATLNRVLSSE